MIRTALLTAAIAACLVAVPAEASAGGCYDTSVKLSVEENRLAKPIPQAILRDSGLDKVTAAFGASLCSARDARAATRVVREHGRDLWQRAVRTAQTGNPDDRPLYWARLRVTTLLHQWKPRYKVDRDALLREAQRTTRGIDTATFARAERKVLVTGFDPFVLDQDIRRSNPSGVSALALDGTVVQTKLGPARVQTMVFPVLWDPFAEGIVEHALKGVLPKADTFVTVSQGRPGRFDLEHYNGRWRGGYPDNENLSRTGRIPIPARVPTVHPAPEFVPSTLPASAILAASTGPFPVQANHSVVEIPSGAKDPVFQPAGPTPGSTARQGGGGDYLSNEIAYRATLLRDALTLPIPGGHLHTPVLTFGTGNTEQVTDPDFEKNRANILSQTKTLITAAAGSTDSTWPAPSLLAEVLPALEP